ncbi:Uncharacterized protein OS=Myxococcus fulvus (strain ATCC BAA-855 / HW-1) GN=LILAB_05520 PE=4 SV=1: DUF4139 [Gemmata massiliana]|uniref:DUF4139 domain-containing protein n=1 Tax=Gemmata massiliana TaxID=1210884 RepID=A0A6P2DL88_9BACT|nr:hypothetical protein [Gemmata massiliana]VTS02457.1 Uncharacterized protein OS=Myxococcus fulvus (strain ATCC BAA-855 / HW-1) GN=LILAB_05520 PE=4 SV=1: DUF4139 [Gemmata massiliana]
MSDLPIRQVVLYKHGVGYFERETNLEGDQSLSLSFKQREVSDVLKSLTVLDLNGGIVSAVSYDSTTPIEQLLAEIALSIPDSGSLKGLLPQIKGARVSVKPTGGSVVQGTILGIDKTDARTEHGLEETHRLSLLTDAGDIRTFDLFDLELTLLDDGIKRDLDFYLRTQLASKKKDARTFTLFAQGEGKRTIRVSYVLEAPVWKATYRILLDEGEGSSPLIQGWAVVDNTSDEDWQDVSLTLVAGLPVSFTHDLYTPRYIRRPVVEVKETTGVLPPMAEAGVEDYEVTGELMAFSAPAAPAPARMAKMRRRESIESVEKNYGSRSSAVSSVQAQTRERQVGDLFEYSIDKPVTVRRNQSALVPILLKPFAGRSVLLYQKSARAENPIRCVEFENTTGLTLEGGPVTVLEQGSYVGEAMLDTLKPTEKRLVGYAVELAARVLDNIDSHSDRVTRVTIRNGTLKTHYAEVQKTTYTFNSKSDKEQVVYLDHPRDDSRWKLVETAKPHETTENYWRFRFTLPPGTASKFVVQQQQTLFQSFGLADITDKLLATWVSAKYLDKATEKALKEVLAQRQQVGRTEEKLAQLNEERNKIHAEQKRIRENLGALGDRASEKALRERFVATLDKQEDRLAKITEEEAKLQTDRDEARERLNAALAKLEYDAPVLTEHAD